MEKLFVTIILIESFIVLLPILVRIIIKLSEIIKDVYKFSVILIIAVLYGLEQVLQSLLLHFIHLFKPEQRSEKHVPPQDQQLSSPA